MALPFLYLFSQLIHLVSAQNTISDIRDIYQPWPDSGQQILQHFFPNTTFFENLTNHGCWCSKFSSQTSISKNIAKGGFPIDDLDIICKKWFQTRNCNKNLIGGSCYYQDDNFIDANLNYYYQIQRPNTGSSSTDFTCNAVNQNTGRTFENCEYDSCIIDLYYVNMIYDLLLFSLGQGSNNFDDISLFQTLDKNECQKSGINIPADECSGQVPHLKPITYSAEAQDLPGYSRIDYFYSNRNYQYQKITVPGLDEENGSTSFTLEFEVRAKNDAHVLFCDDQEIDLSFNPRTENTNCLELVLGGWGNSRSIFRYAPQANKNPLIDFIFSSVLNQNSFRNFKVVFDGNGDLSVFRVSDGDYQIELDGMERDQEDKLVDLSHVTRVNNLKMGSSAI